MDDKQRSLPVPSPVSPTVPPAVNLVREAELDDSLVKSSPWARAYTPARFELVRWIGDGDDHQMARVLYVMPWRNRPSVLLMLGPGQTRWEWISMIRPYKPPPRRRGRPINPNACSRETLRRRARASGTGV